MEKPDQLMTKQQAAFYCNVGERTLNRLMRSGKVKFYRIGGQVRFDKAQLREVLEVDNSEKDHDPMMG